MSETAATLSLFSLPACSHITVNHLTFLTSAFEKCVTITSWINLGILDLSHELMVSWKPQSCTSSSPHCLLVLIFRTCVPLAISFSSALLWPEKVQLTFNALGCPMLSALGGGTLRSLQSVLKQWLCHAGWHKVCLRPANRSFSFPLTYGFNCVLGRLSLWSTFKLSLSCPGLA